MKRFVLFLAALLAACGDATGPEVPGLAATLPRAGAGDVSVATPIRLTFPRDIRLPTDTAGAVWLTEGTARVPARVTQPTGAVLLLTPPDILNPATRYTVHIGAGITDSRGTVAATAFDFTTRGARTPQVDGARLIGHVRALAHDSMQGRGSLTPAELKAASYIRAEFGRYGLSAVSSGEWFQTFAVTGVGNSQNVVGVLRGAGSLQDEWVIIGGHYDHIGIRNGLINNGADDNASGTAAVLELARLLAQHKSNNGFGSADRRSLMFVAFGAEELGLVGSNFYCKYPLVPLTSVSAMINMDMIGRLQNNTVYLIGENTGQEWAAMVRRYNATFTYAAMGDAGTDYRCFKTAGRPVMSLFTGLHADYHKPTDDTELIDVPGFTAIAQLALELAVNTAVRPRPFTP
ncbi:MAG: M28 family peptidase [Gemmatimonadetes bacterium]|nr:M28 family peptidase [Gemmatimonadota bacterium]